MSNIANPKICQILSAGFAIVINLQKTIFQRNCPINKIINTYIINTMNAAKASFHFGVCIPVIPVIFSVVGDNPHFNESVNNYLIIYYIRN